jgi:hypothetical protein
MAELEKNEKMNMDENWDVMPAQAGIQGREGPEAPGSRIESGMTVKDLSHKQLPIFFSH